MLELINYLLLVALHEATLPCLFFFFSAVALFIIRQAVLPLWRKTPQGTPRKAFLAACFFCLAATVIYAVFTFNFNTISAVLETGIGYFFAPLLLSGIVTVPYICSVISGRKSIVPRKAGYAVLLVSLIFAANFILEKDVFYFGKTVRLTMQLPKGMSVDHAQTYFESTDCERSGPAYGDNWETATKPGKVGYDKTAQAYIVDLLLEKNDLMCNWRPRSIYVYGKHPDARGYDGRHEQSIGIAYFYISDWPPGAKPSAQEELLCRWYDSFSYTDAKYPHIACYNPKKPRSGNRLFLRPDKEKQTQMAVSVRMEQKPGGGFYHYTENPKYQKSR